MRNGGIGYRRWLRIGGAQGWKLLVGTLVVAVGPPPAYP
jgi:hypothetical protein